MKNPLDPQVVEKVEVGKQEEVKPTEALINTNIVEEAELMAVSKSLGADKISDIKKYEEQTRRVIDWAKARGAESITDIVAEISLLKSRVGGNLYNLSVYAGLEMDRMRIESQMRKLEAGK